MTRDPSDAPLSADPVLESLGWQPFFADQITREPVAQPIRITEVHRNGLRGRGIGLDPLLPPSIQATVGDWLLFDAETPAASVVLDRKSLIKRRAPGIERQIQLIAANIDTVFIVSSCNLDFNIARLERYVALVLDAGVAPVIVLTKADLTDTPETYAKQAREISDLVPVVVLNAKFDEPKEKLEQWCQRGQTVAFLGSSGVGKSTLTNALIEEEVAKTQGIREDDARGRHTTTRRQLHIIPNGCAVIDTPGMRELQLTDAGAGVAALFPDLYEISTQCKFRDCTHTIEPGCAVRAAAENGSVDSERLARWEKLTAEEKSNSAILEMRKSTDKTTRAPLKFMKRQMTKAPKRRR
jgi:ribosome biogenesis GTPase